MSPFVCTSATYETDWVATEVMLFAGAPTQVPGFNSTDWVRADGQSLSIETFDYLYAASEPTTVSGSTFAVPDLTPPAPGLEYWIVSHGSWPTYSW
jgi:microcystin-dependent protein